MTIVHKRLILHKRRILHTRLILLGTVQLFPAEGIYESTKPLIGREKEGLKSFAMLLQRPIPPFALNPYPATSRTAYS